MEKNFLHHPVLLAICIVIPLLAGVAGSFATLASIPTWYAGLIKPPLTPPAWVFGPVWTVLYILMGISLYLVVRENTDDQRVRQGIVIFSAQLIVNVLWSVVFFGLRSPVLGVVVIIILIALIIATIYYFYPVSRIAAMLLLPYIAWVCAATYLNIMILFLN